MLRLVGQVSGSAGRAVVLFVTGRYGDINPFLSASECTVAAEL